MHTTPQPASGSLWGAQETQFFYALTPEHVFSAVESTGLRCTGRCTALNSMENRVYEVEVETEEELRPSDPRRYRIAKFYRPGRWTKEQILEEHEFLRRLEEVDLTVAAPAAISDGSTLGETQNILFAVFPKIAGRTLLHDEISPAQYQRLGRFIARMHNVGAVTSSCARLTLTPATYAEANAAYLLERDLVPEALRARYEKIVSELLALITPLFSRVAVQAIHGDFHLGNIVWSGESPVVVDFDDMVNGPPVQDLWLLLAGRAAETRETLQTIVDAYEQMRSFDRSTLALIEPLRTLRMIHFTAWIARRWSDPAFPRVFPHFGTERYWQEHVRDLGEQLEVIRKTDRA